MKRTIMNRTDVWISASIMLAIILFSQMSLFSSQVAAQDPTPVPTATTAPTWTPVPGVTITPTAGAPVAPTPPGPNPTPTGRLVDFRADRDKIELGECVLFSWTVRGDVAWVEFDEIDDDKEPILVEDQGDRQECPDNETDYELIVTWLDGSRTRRTIEIQVTNSDESGGGGSGSGGANAVPTPGPFVVVTPIALAEIQEATEVAGNFNNFNPSGGAVPPSDHILATIVELPETGELPGKVIASKSSPSTSGAAVLFWLPLIGGLILGLGAVALLFPSSLR